MLVISISSSTPMTKPHPIRPHPAATPKTVSFNVKMVVPLAESVMTLAATVNMVQLASLCRMASQGAVVLLQPKRSVTLTHAMRFAIRKEALLEVSVIGTVGKPSLEMYTKMCFAVVMALVNVWTRMDLVRDFPSWPYPCLCFTGGVMIWSLSFPSFARAPMHSC